MGERTRAVQGKEKRELLVQFLGYEHPEWACEVSKPLLARWERAQPKAMVESNERIYDPGVFEAMCTPQAVAEGQVNSLLAEVQRILWGNRWLWQYLHRNYYRHA